MTFRIATSGFDSGTSPQTVTVPSGTADGDIVLFARGFDSAGRTITALPSGFTALDDLSDGSSWVAAIGVVSGSPPASWQFSYSAAELGSWVCLVYQAMDTATPQVDNIWARDNTNDTSADAPSVTAPGGFSGTLVSVFSSSGGPTFGAPSGMTSRVSQGAGGSFYAIAAFDQDISSSGATGTRTSTTGASGNGAGFSVLLQAAGGGAQATNKGGIALSSISAINGIAKSSIANINGLTI